MLNYNNIFTQHIDKIKNEDRYREFVDITRHVGNFPKAFCNIYNKEIIMWCINDYLGMSQHAVVLEAAREALAKHGAGTGGTRNIGGNTNIIVELEKEICALHHKEAALVFTSGYVANETTLSTIAKIIPNITFFSDEANHASIIAGISHSRADKYVYEHTNTKHLEELLKQVDINQPKMIVFESVYSMDGLSSPIKEICALAKKYNALTFLDEVHSVGLYGEGGAGVANMSGCESQIDILQATLAKSYGAIGGYITANSNLIDAIRSTASGFIFTTSLPPVVVAAATASMRYLKNSDAERLALQRVVSLVKSKFDAAKIKYFKNDSHIIPIIIGDPVKAKQASRMLLKNHGIYVQHINFPTVPKGSERLRIIPTPVHTEQMIENLVSALLEVFDLLNIKPFSTLTAKEQPSDEAQNLYYCR